jgi:hypothetical protein
MRRILVVDDDLVEGDLVEGDLPARPAMRASPQRGALTNALCDQQGGTPSNISRANLSQANLIKGEGLYGPNCQGSCHVTVTRDFIAAPASRRRELGGTLRQMRNLKRAHRFFDHGGIERLKTRMSSGTFA